MKKELLNTLQKTMKLNRGYIAWILCNHGKKVRTGQRIYVIGDVSKKPKKITSHVTYGHDCQQALEYFWICADRINSKHLKSALSYLIEKYKLFVHPQHYTDEVLDKLCAMSHWTIDRLLKSTRASYGKKRISHTNSEALLKHKIKIRTHADWNEQTPGYLEMDLVGHEGGNPAGEFCFTLNMIDIQTCWSEYRNIKIKLTDGCWQL
jgi:hypothetical protein